MKEWILSQSKEDRRMVEYDKGGGRRLLVEYTEDRARKDAYNRDKGIRRLEKAYKSGRLTKENFNMSVDKVLAMAQTVTTIKIKLPLNKQTIRKTMIMERHKRIAPLFSYDFWVTR